MVELMISMDNMKILALITFWFGFILAMSGTLLSFMFFKTLKKNYATYYKSIGEPLAIAPVNFTESSYAQLLKGSVFLYSMVFRGIPKDFPKDIGLRKLARAIRIVLVILTVLFVTLVVFGYFLYKSGL
jgi:hypothetical protein